MESHNRDVENAPGASKHRFHPPSCGPDRAAGSRGIVGSCDCCTPLWSVVFDIYSIPKLAGKEGSEKVSLLRRKSDRADCLHG